MRNVRIASLARHRLDLSDTHKNSKATQIRAVAVDANQDDSIYCATTTGSLTSSTLVDLDVWQVKPFQRHVSSFSAPLYAPFPSHEQIVSFDYLNDGGSFVQDSPALCLISAGGDIALTPCEGEDQSSSSSHPMLPEIVGSVEQGILAASWSPDQELLVIITAPTSAELAEDGKAKGSSVLLMTREFEVLSENPLQTDDFGEERPIALGWGSKATQFHGSEGKQAAAAAAAAAEQVQDTNESTRGPLLPTDDGKVRVSWRGDSSIFVVSAPEAFNLTSEHRVIRTFGKNGNLLATSDLHLRGISHTLAFKPTGILMATTQMDEGNHTVTFIERNGLRKNSFPLRESDAVRELAWNSDGTLLAVWIANKLQIWATGNYHWYLKQQITLDSTSITGFRWHNEISTDLFLSTPAETYSFQFVLDSCVSSVQCTPHDAACAAVIDGSNILLTPFRLQNIPPPMSSMQINVGSSVTPIDIGWGSVAVTQTESVCLLKVLLPNGVVQVWVVEFSSAKQDERWKQPWRLCTIEFGLQARQIAAFAHRKGDYIKFAVGVLAVEGFETLKLATHRMNWRTRALGNTRFESLSLGRPQRRMLVSAPPLALQESYHGSVVVARNVFVQEPKLLRDISGDRLPLPLANFRQLALLSVYPAATQVVGLTEGGQLFLNSKLLARDANSFVLTDTHIIWTNVAHESCFLKVDEAVAEEETDLQVKAVAAKESVVPLSRRVERGSRIVTAVPSNMTLILQMPRGNLETISPRPLVLEVVTRSLKERRYGRAFRICRTHRLDMNILVDYDEERFLKDAPLFVRQVKDSEHLNLFLSSLSESARPMRIADSRTIGRTEQAPRSKEEADAVQRRRDRINAICDAIRDVLERNPDADSFVNTILTTFVRKSPPDHSAALHMLGELKKKDAAVADEACKYIIFLTDADKLFNAALGTYDFTLPLLVAHHSPRKDPREYLPFLRELRQVKPEEIQRYKIDEYLERWELALEWLVKAGDDYHSDAMAFIQTHELYLPALRLYATDVERLKQVQEVYGDWLMERHRYKEAGVLFLKCQQKRKAVDADVKAGLWREALASAEVGKQQGEISASDLKKLAQRIAASLSSYGRNVEAATVVREYLDDTEEDQFREAVNLLCKDLEFGEAKRIAAHHQRDLTTEIQQAVTESAETLQEEIAEIHDQGSKQFARLQELRIRKRERPDEYYPDVDGGDGAIDDGASQAFTMFTRFTRYSAFTSNAAAAARRRQSGEGSTMSQFTMRTKAPTQTAKSRKKEMRKQGTGKKNSIYEEDYLFTSLTKLVGSERLGKVQRDASKILLQLVRCESTEEERRAKQIAESLDSLERELNTLSEQLFNDGLDDEDSLEQERIRAIEEGIALGLSWTQLQANGLFAAPMHRERVAISAVEWRQPALLAS